MDSIKNFFVIDQKTGNISHTKLWSNVGYITVIGSYIYSVVTGGTIDPTLLSMFGAIIIGNRSVIKIANTFNKGK